MRQYRAPKYYNPYYKEPQKGAPIPKSSIFACIVWSLEPNSVLAIRLNPLGLGVSGRYWDNFEDLGFGVWGVRETSSRTFPRYGSTRALCEGFVRIGQRRPSAKLLYRSASGCLLGPCRRMVYTQGSKGFPYTYF